MKKNRMILVFIAAFCLFNQRITTHADMIPETSTYAEYNLVEGETETIQIADLNNQPVYVTISKDFSPARALGNGTYKITYTSPGAWKAGYKINISNNTITSVHSPYHFAITGNVQSGRLVKNNSKQVSYYVIYKKNGLRSNPCVRSKISGNTLKIYMA